MVFIAVIKTGEDFFNGLKLKMDKQDTHKFISGIYNYCDRWCERCSLSSRCLLSSREKKRLDEHRKKREDPYDWKIVMKDVEEDLKEALVLIRKAAKERGIDLETVPEMEYEPPDPHRHPLFRTAEKYQKLAYKFLKKFRQIIQEEGIDLTKRIEIVPSPEKETKSFQEIAFCYETILWYHTLILAKIYRALTSVREVSPESHCEEPKLVSGDEAISSLAVNIDRNDSEGSAKVAYLGLTESIKALQKIYHWDENLEDDILPLLILAEQLRKGIDKEFPGHRHFKRPGFDE